MRILPILGLVASVAGCSSDDRPLTNATSLNCPYPGDLPFRLPTSGFQKPVNEMTTSTEKQSKDEAFDILGVPGGVQASVAIDDATSPSATGGSYDGTKGRTTPNGGLISDALPGEHVSLWFHDTAWQQVGTATTDEAGAYHIATTGFAPTNGAPVYSMLDADGSCAVHTSYLYPAGTNVVVFDIDGTLTTDDNQIAMQSANEAYVPQMMTAANTLTQAWHDQGYPVVYLTARPNILLPESRAWLQSQMFADGPLITEGGSKTADAYKTLWLDRLTTDFGWKVFAAYGNADTDITAYANVGLKKDQTFIIGPLSTNANITGIPNMDYTAHIQSYVKAQPKQTLP